MDNNGFFCIFAVAKSGLRLKQIFDLILFLHARFKYAVRRHKNIDIIKLDSYKQIN